jgi:hypothetical protein
MYGAKYIGHYKALLYLWYKEGSSNSEMKVSPSLMEKMLWAMYPGIYTKPSFTEIKSFVSQLFLKEKKNEDTLPVTSWKSMAVPLASVVLCHFAFQVSWQWFQATSSCLRMMKYCT